MPEIKRNIFDILKDMEWHTKDDFCRPWSQDDKRLREMRLDGWLDYECQMTKNGKDVIFTQYRVTKIYPIAYKKLFIER